jgi:hypothetical protein
VSGNREAIGLTAIRRYTQPAGLCILRLGGFLPYSLIFVEWACEVNNCQAVLLRKSVQVLGCEKSRLFEIFLPMDAKEGGMPGLPASLVFPIRGIPISLTEGANRSRVGLAPYLTPQNEKKRFLKKNLKNWRVPNGIYCGGNAAPDDLHGKQGQRKAISSQTPPPATLTTPCQVGLSSG